MEPMPLIEFPQRHPPQPSEAAPSSDLELLLVSQSGGNGSLLSKCTPVSEEQTDAIMIMRKEPSPYRSILYKEKLSSNGSNFMDWYRNLRLVLRHEKREYILNTPLPPIPGDKSSTEVLADFNKHMLDEHEVQCLLLTCMGPELQSRFLELPSFQIMDQLKNMFQKPARFERYELVKSLLGCKMSEGSSVSAHMLKMMSYIRRLEMLGYPLGSLATDFVLNSLPPSYSEFIMFFHMNGMEKSLYELYGMLTTAEETMKIHGSLHVLSVNESGKKIRKGKNKRNAKKGSGKGNTQVETSKAFKGATSETECFYCEGKGHWKRNCFKYLADLKSGKVQSYSDTKKSENAS